MVSVSAIVLVAAGFAARGSSGPPSAAATTNTTATTTAAGATTTAASASSTTAPPYSDAEALAKAGYYDQAKDAVAADASNAKGVAVPADLRASKLSDTIWWDTLLGTLTFWVRLFLVVAIGFALFNLLMRLLGRKVVARVGWTISHWHPHALWAPLVWVWQPELQIADAVGDVGPEFSGLVRDRLRLISSEYRGPSIQLATGSDETFSIPDLSSLDPKLAAVSGIATMLLRRDVLTLSTWLDASDAKRLTCIAELTGARVSRSVILWEPMLDAAGATDAPDYHQLLAARLAAWISLVLQDERPSWSWRKKSKTQREKEVDAFGTRLWQSFAPFLSGIEAVRAGRSDLAEERFIQALSADPENLKALLNLSTLRLQDRSDAVRVGAIAAIYSLLTGEEAAEGSGARSYPVPAQPNPGVERFKWIKRVTGINWIKRSRRVRRDKGIDGIDAQRAMFTLAVALGDRSQRSYLAGNRADAAVRARESVKWAGRLVRSLLDGLPLCERTKVCKDRDRDVEYLKPLQRLYETMLEPAVVLLAGLSAHARMVDVESVHSPGRGLQWISPALLEGVHRPSSKCARAVLAEGINAIASDGEQAEGFDLLDEWLIKWLKLRALADGPMVVDATSLYNLACYYVTIGQLDEAFTYLEWTFCARPRDRQYADRDPVFAMIKHDPRWTKLMAAADPPQPPAATAAPATAAKT